MTSEVHPYLGAHLGTDEYMENFMQNKAIKWKTTVEMLAEIALTEPKAAYSVFTRAMI